MDMIHLTSVGVSGILALDEWQIEAVYKVV